VSADLPHRLRICAGRYKPDTVARHIMREAAFEIEKIHDENDIIRDRLARLRERVTMLEEAAADDQERAARLERVITNKEPLL